MTLILRTAGLFRNGQGISAIQDELKSLAKKPMGFKALHFTSEPPFLIGQ
jgi:hypothetical protein